MSFHYLYGHVDPTIDTLTIQLSSGTRRLVRPRFGLFFVPYEEGSYVEELWAYDGSNRVALCVRPDGVDDHTLYMDPLDCQST